MNTSKDLLLLDDHHFRALREIERDGTVTQRDLAGRIGVSLGMVNYVVRSLMEKGFIKARRFKNARNKLAYMYVITPHGIRQRLEITSRFLAEKRRQYEQLQLEIEELTREVNGTSGGDGDGRVRGRLRNGNVKKGDHT